MKHWRMGLALIGTFGVMGGASAFDTGHHADMTRDAMSEFGMNANAIGVAQAENWLVDYYSSQPTTGLDHDLENLHFDNLTTTAEIQNYWGRLTINTEQAVRGAAQANNPVKIVALMGMSLHAVQDFYTHSNWVELRRPVVNPASYDTRTWFDAGPAAPGLRTGKYPSATPATPLVTDHGNYTLGMNHDSYVRPRWDEAYVYGWNASRQWIEAIRSWVMAVNPGVWPSVQALVLAPNDLVALQRDLEASHRISEWIVARGNNGHWKGSGSGSGASFNKFVLGWTARRDSLFVRHFKVDHWHQELTNNLNAMPPPIAIPPLAPVPPMNKKALRVQTVGFDELVNPGEARVNGRSNPNYYARVTISGQTFIEAMQYQRANAAPDWQSIKLVDSAAAAAPIVYELRSQNGTANVLCDINPVIGNPTLNFTFTFPTPVAAGFVAGDIAGAAGAVITTGGAGAGLYRARVNLRIDSLPLL